MVVGSNFSGERGRVFVGYRWSFVSCEEVECVSVCLRLWDTRWVAPLFFSMSEVCRDVPWAEAL